MVKKKQTQHQRAEPPDLSRNHRSLSTEESALGLGGRSEGTAGEQLSRRGSGSRCYGVVRFVGGGDGFLLPKAEPRFSKKEKRGRKKKQV